MKCAKPTLIMGVVAPTLSKQLALVRSCALTITKQTKLMKMRLIVKNDRHASNMSKSCFQMAGEFLHDFYHNLAMNNMCVILDLSNLSGGVQKCDVVGKFECCNCDQAFAKHVPF